jgi:hypothetical protein
MKSVFNNDNVWNTLFLTKENVYNKQFYNKLMQFKIKLC